MFVTSYSVTFCINVLGKPGICLYYYCAVYDECKYSDTFWLADRTRFLSSTLSHFHQCALFWRHWTYTMPARYILSSVWVRLSILSPLSIIQYVGLRFFFSLAISLVVIERIYILCLIMIIKLEVWTTTYCLGLGHETMVSAAFISIFLTLNPYVWPYWLSLGHSAHNDTWLSNTQRVLIPRFYCYKCT